MGFIKCPRCELNYILDSEKLCKVCRKEVSGEAEQYETIEYCSQCGENPVEPGEMLCASCLREQSRAAEDANEDRDELRDGTIDIDNTSPSDLSEIDIDSQDDDIESSKIKEDADGFFDDDDDDDEEDDEYEE